MVSKAPAHVAIIPDGNRRWADKNGLSTKDGHKEGYENLKRIADLAFSKGAKFLTAYTFSTENWSRAEDEVGYLMKMASWVVKEEAIEYHKKGIRLIFLGSREGIEVSLVEGLKEAEELTQHNTKGTICICFNYGGRRDIVDAVNRMIESGVNSVDEQSFPNWLSTKGVPDPDLVIRTSGEHRLSNFLVWESAYSEMYFADCLWPDFDERELNKAIEDFYQRQRRFGA